MIAVPIGTHSRVARRRVWRRLRFSPCRRCGAAAVEFAVVAPLFFLLLFGMIEFGRMIMVQQLLTHACRDGARQAVIEGSSASQVTQGVRDYLTGASVNGTAATISITPSDLATSTTGQPVKVEVSIAYSQASWLPAPWFLGGATLKAASTMRRE